MISKFLEASVNFQNGTVWLMYGVIAAVLMGIAVLMYVSANKKGQK